MFPNAERRPWGRGAWSALLGALLLMGCATVPAPRGVLPQTQEAARKSVGGWATLQTAGAQGPLRREGELLAVSADSLWILERSGVAAIPIDAVRGGTLAGYDSAPGRVLGLGLLGTLSTISNGFFLVFTAPGWLIATAIATTGQARQPVIRLPVVDWRGLALYARFPPGMPAGVDRGSLVPVR